MKHSINILVCTHQDGFIYHSEILRPIIVGAANLGEEADKLQLNLESSISKISIGGGALNNGDSTQVFRDDTGDNISHLNPYFCELTAMYWAWKNLDSAYYGLFHYRRVLDLSGRRKNNIAPWRKKKHDVNTIKISPHNIPKQFHLDTTTITNLLKKSPIIVANPLLCIKGFDFSLGMSQYDIYARDHNKKDLDIVIEILRTKFPHMTNYMEATLFTPGTRLSWCNMFVMSKELFFEYCEFLFGILLEAQKHIDTKGYNTYQKRAFGFIAERLFNVFLRYIVFEKNIDPISRDHFELKEPKPLFGSQISGKNPPIKRTYFAGIRIKKTQLKGVL